MKTICIAMQKGGVGKTSSSVSLAAELARQGGKTVLIDCDPQGSASSWLAPDALSSELADVLSKTVETKEAIHKTELDGLDILPSAGMGGGLKVFAETAAASKPFCIQALTKNLADMRYEYCVIDEGPGWGNLERAAALASNEIITPIMPDFFGLDGLGLFFDNLRQLREDMNLSPERPMYNKILVNALDNRIGQHGDVLAKIKERDKFCLYIVPVDPIFRKAQSAGCTIQSMTGAKPETVTEIGRLAKDIIGGLTYGEKNYKGSHKRKSG